MPGSGAFKRAIRIKGKGGRRLAEAAGRAGAWAGLALEGLLDLICPPACPLCGRLVDPDPDQPRAPNEFCPECLEEMPPLPEGRCRACGIPYESDQHADHLCASCRVRRPAFDQALAAGLFQGALRKAVHRFKYHGQTGLAPPLADLMKKRLHPPYFPPEADLILPVPLHVRRLRQRGYNQALILARALYHPWQGAVRWDLLTRSRWTEPQVTLAGPARRKNVRLAFAVSRPEAVQGRSVILIDDVYTTGATVEECALALKRAGAKRVSALTLARVKP